MTPGKSLAIVSLDDPRDTLKMVRETFAIAQQRIVATRPEHRSDQRHAERLGRLIAEIDRQRPLGPDGKHGNLHTPTCECEEN